MAISNLHFHLMDGFIHNWLVAGPDTKPVPQLSTFQKDGLESSILKNFYTPDSGVTEKPIDVGPLTKNGDIPDPLTWRYYRCIEDHFIDFTSVYPTCAYVRAWAYTEIETPQSVTVDCALTTNGPADLWLNGGHIYRQDQFQKSRPATHTFQLPLQAGNNQLLLRFETVGLRESPFVVAFHITGLNEDTEIIIPTEIESEYFDARKAYEELIPKAYMEKYVFGSFNGDTYDKNEPIVVKFDQDLKLSQPAALAYRLQSLQGDIFQEGNKMSDGHTVYELAKNFPLRNGTHQLELAPEAGMYYMKKVQLKRHDTFYVVRTAYSDHYYSIIHERRREAIEDAALRRGDSLYTEIAKMVMGVWEKVDKRILQRAFDRINQRQDGRVTDVIGFIGVLLRFRRKPEFPRELRTSIETCLASFRYWEDEPGEDIMDFKTESRQILFHTCEILAGQALLDRNFTNSNQNGRWHVEKGERLANAWLSKHGSYGWQDWDSPIGFEEELTALSHLVDFANSYTLSELASILIDKTLFSLAINSNKGAFGSTHGRSDTASLLSARLDPTSGITRVMWGMGNFNEHVMGSVSLAQTKKYDFTNLLKNIAVRPVDGFWDRERQGRGAEPGKKPREVNKVTYKTNDYMLCSAQNYDSFLPGSQAHIWQATLGPDAIVFTNHPACISENDGHRPNFWNGNTSQPRVVQWGDVLFAQYSLPENDWLGFTHAYFPIKTFDEYTVEKNWAFARKGKGYLALYSQQDIELITHGQSAYRELRAYSKEQTWVCHMGQELLDGSFENFQQKIHGLNPAIEGLSIRLNNLRGDELVFGPEPHLLVNGEEQAISGFRHYENPYCIAEYPAEKMDIVQEDQGIRLNFAEE